MSDVILDGKTKVAVAPTIASGLLVPTLAEITDGEAISPVMPADGLRNFDPTSAKVDTTGIESTFDTFAFGRTGFGDTALVLKWQGAVDPIFDLLTAYGTNLNLIIRVGLLASTAFAAAQKVSVYPIMLGQWSWLDLGTPNSVVRYMVPIGISTQPNLQAAITA